MHQKNISLPEELIKAIDDFNSKHPYEKLNISSIAQKAIHDKIKSLDPDILIDSKTAQSVTLDTLILTVDKKPQSEPISKELTCDYCGNSFTAISPKAKFCSGKCKSADYRKRRKEDYPVSK
jgi:endogenous inhibitor of DNA gyrase (YacG/DUF329 family)